MNLVCRQCSATMNISLPVKFALSNAIKLSIIKVHMFVTYRKHFRMSLPSLPQMLKKQSVPSERFALFHKNQKQELNMIFQLTIVLKLVKNYPLQVVSIIYAVFYIICNLYIFLAKLSMNLCVFTLFQFYIFYTNFLDCPYQVFSMQSLRS